MNLKKRTAIISVCLVAVLLVSAFGVAKLISNIDMAEYTAQAQKIFNQAKTEVEQIRNVTLPNDVTLYVITKQDAVDRWGKGSADANLALIRRQENVYKNLFILSENDSLYQATVDWTANWGAATLGNTEIYVIKENFDPYKLPEAEATFVHELTHIWQPDLPYPTTFDGDKAHTSLVEGDASYMGDYFMNKSKAQASPLDLYIGNVPVFLITNPMLSKIRLMPDTMWKLNFFPYDQGKTFVNALYSNGGWATINNAYQNPPNSTEQIIHPGKYFQNETAQEISAPTLADGSWNLVKTDRNQNSDTFGECFIQVMLGRWLSKNEAQAASAGWSGDNFTYYEKGNEYLFTWNIKWDSSCDAGEFYVAFNNVLNATGAVKQNCTHWLANGRYISISWNQDTNSTLIAGSTNESAVLPSNLK